MKTGIVTFGVGAVVGAIIMVAGISLGGGFSPQKAAATPMVAAPAGLTQEQKAFYAQATDLYGKFNVFAARIDKEFAKVDREAIESSLFSDLQTMRSQLELYKVQHLENYPSPDRFTQQLLLRTNAKGELMPDNAQAKDYPFGPYLQQMPANPFIRNTYSARMVKFGHGACPGDKSTGWYMDLDSGKFNCNDPSHTNM